MNLTIKQRIFLSVVCLYILSVTNTFFSAFFLISPILYPLLVIGCCVLLYGNKLLRNKCFKATMIYCLVLLIIPFIHSLSAQSFSYGTGDYNTALIEIAFILPSVMISSIIYENNNPKEIKIISYVSIISIVSSLIYMIPLMIADPSIARLYAEHSNENYNLSNSQLAVAIFFWSYPMFHAIALLLPVFMVVAKQANVFHIVSWVLPVMVIVAIFQSSIATTISYALLVIIASIWIRDNKINKASLIFILVALLLFISYLPLFFNSILDIYRGTAMEQKLRDLFSILNGGYDTNGTMTVRSNYHVIAWKCFLNSPIWGGYVPINGHSVFLNRLGSLGLIGICPFLWFLYYNYKSFSSYIKDKFGLKYKLSWVGALILLYSKGLFGQEGYVVILVIVPTIFLWLRNTQSQRL